MGRGRPASSAHPLTTLRSALLGGGKRLRPAFCYWSFVGAGGDPDAPASSTPAPPWRCCTPPPSSTTTSSTAPTGATAPTPSTWPTRPATGRGGWRGDSAPLRHRGGHPARRPGPGLQRPAARRAPRRRPGPCSTRCGSRSTWASTSTSWAPAHGHGWHAERATRGRGDTGPAHLPVQDGQVHRRAPPPSGRRAGRPGPGRRRWPVRCRPSACPSARPSSSATTCSTSSAIRSSPASRSATTCGRASPPCSSAWPAPRPPAPAPGCSRSASAGRTSPTPRCSSCDR